MNTDTPIFKVFNVTNEFTSCLLTSLKYVGLMEMLLTGDNS